MEQKLSVGDIVTWTTYSQGRKIKKKGRIVRFFKADESASYIADKEFGTTHRKMFRPCFAYAPGVLVEELVSKKNTNKIKLNKPYVHRLIKTEG